MPQRAQAQPQITCLHCEGFYQDSISFFLSYPNLKVLTMVWGGFV